MKKIKKLLAGILTMAMLLTSITLTAFAASDGFPVIDTTKQGILTIHKYEKPSPEITQPGTLSGTTADEPTGTGMKPLSGATFTIYKVGDITQTSADGVMSVNQPTLEEAKEIVAAGKIGDTAIETKEQTTTSEGKATFTELSLGYYLVRETNPPENVTVPTPDFLISIPMTEYKENGATTWNYDVHVYPKNGIDRKDITLSKTGIVLKPDGTKNTTALDGAAFQLQRKSGTTWTTAVESSTTAAGGSITYENLEKGFYRYKELSAPTGYIVDAEYRYFEVALDKTATENKTLKAYPVSKIDDENVLPAVIGEDGLTIKVDNEKPTVDKKVKTGEDTYDKTTSKNIGDTVSWEVTATIPKTIKELKTYKIVDTLSTGLSKATDLNLVVKAGEETLTSETDYTVSGETQQIIVDFTDSGKTKLANLMAGVVKVTFDTILNDKAVIGSAGNPNEVKLVYSNTTDTTTEPGTTSETTPEETPAVFIWGVKIIKIDADNQEQKLSGAEFKITKGDNIVATGTSNENGEVVFDKDQFEVVGENGVGLANGTYKITETKAPAGYNLLKDSIEFTVTVNPVKPTGVNKQWTATVEGSNNGVFEYTIKNSKGFELPTTGGMGTLLFTVIGVALMLGAVVLGLSMRKKKA